LAPVAAILAADVAIGTSLLWLIRTQFADPALRDRIEVAATLLLATALATLPIVIPRLRALVRAAQGARMNERRFLTIAASSNDALFILSSVRDASGEIVDFRFARGDRRRIAVRALSGQCRGRFLRAI
jgi:hypothetical protein